MPYAKKHHRKFGKRKRTVSKAVKRYVKKEIRQAPEVKYTELTTIGPGANVTGSGAVYSFSGYPTQGTSVGGRIGDKIMIKSVYMNMLLEGSQCVTLASYYPTVQVRVIVGLWKKTTGGVGLPTIAQVLDMGVATGMNAIYQNDYRSEWTKLMDKTVTLSSSLGAVGATQLTGVSSNARVIRKTFRINKPMLFINNGGAVTGCLTNIPFLIVLSNTPGGVTYPTCYTYSRIHYTDM